MQLDEAILHRFNLVAFWDSARFIPGPIYREGFCDSDYFLMAGGSSQCSRTCRYFAEAAEFCAVQRHHGGADTASRQRAWIRRSWPRCCLQGSRQVLAALLMCRNWKSKMGDRQSDYEIVLVVSRPVRPRYAFLIFTKTRPKTIVCPCNWDRSRANSIKVTFLLIYLKFPFRQNGHYFIFFAFVLWLFF